jgi:hypothetical protein
MNAMGEHKHNPVAIYYKENPWAPDPKPYFGRRIPRGKGIRRIYRIMMEGQKADRASAREASKALAETSKPKMKANNEESLYKGLNPKRVDKDGNQKDKKSINQTGFLSSLRLRSLRLIQEIKSVLF